MTPHSGKLAPGVVVAALALLLLMWLGVGTLAVIYATSRP